MYVSTNLFGDSRGIVCTLTVMMNNHMGDLVKAIGDISDSSKNIAKIIKTIDEIAFQTNILALNAAASTELSSQAELLQEAVAKFRI